MLQAQINETVLELIQGDITHQDTDAVVNSANPTLGGGGGVDGAIHRAAGPKLLAETRKKGGCEVGDAKITKGYTLKARHVIHTVGPIYDPNNPKVAAQLASSYRRSLEVAVENGLKTIAFPAISTGIYAYPLEEAAPIALRTVIDFAGEAADSSIELIRFVLFNKKTYDAFSAALRQLASADSRVLLKTTT
ncbi:MAG: O-acetyl-ADP-ribose deacetylase [Phototrophicales bacterium]|nr:MAG: O-acetyl-ADP-ribose deacetylase [Phototrophicales bacterium]